MMPRTRVVTSARSDNLRVVRRLMEEVWGIGDLSLLPELVANDYVGHLPIGDHYGPVGARIDIESYRRALPDLVVIVDDLFAAGDKVVRRFTLRGTHREAFLSIPASGQRIVLRGIAVDDLAAGKLMESWVQIDSMMKRPTTPLEADRGACPLSNR
ncbi:MAG: ester cyclase [Thermomicrobiales bacterium]